MARAVITPRLLTSPQAALYLGVSETKLRDLVGSNRVAQVRIDGSVRFDIRQLDRFIDGLSPAEDGNPVDRFM